MNLYECNPDKNVECSKEGCFESGGLCLFTINSECSLSENSCGTTEKFPNIVHDTDDSGEKLNGIVYIPKEKKMYLFRDGVKIQEYPM